MKKDVQTMVRLTKSQEPLKGWKYPIYIYVFNDEIVNALVNAGVDRELIRQLEPTKIQVFDFIAQISTSTPMNPINRDIIVITIMTNVEIGQSFEVVSIPFKQ